MENKEKRVTKAQRYADLKALLDGKEPPFKSTIQDAQDFIDNEIRLLARKNSSDSKKQTELQEQNAIYMEKIVAYLMEVTDGVDPAKGKTCTEIQKAIPELLDFQNQKIARLCRILAEAGRITGTIVKQKKLWSIA